ncbi:PrgI family protein [Patescibacteria group bacterium]|nr:PrgI family protein [Patescibacteria group bacterium]MBU1922082.1 PrgI family protein [Patescibacteria group bacterium]
MEKFVVPQFIDVEDKIIGPVTTRQFVIMLADFFLIFISYKLLVTALFIPIAVILLGVGIVISFIKVNGMPFHFFLLNLTQTLKKPKLRIWDKELATSELRMYIKSEVTKPAPIPPKKEPLATSRLSELVLVANTGGLYKPEDYA